MKINLAIIALIAMTASTVFATTDDAGNNEYKLPDGRVLKNPLVLERLPDGLEIGHDRGVVFVKFANLPEDVQKKYNYDPDQAKQYEKARKNTQLANEIQKATATQNDEARRIAMKQEEKKALDIKIAKLELRMKFLDEEIPKLETEGATYLDKITEIESTPTGNNSTSNNFYWRGGYMSNVGNAAMKKDAKTRAKTVEDLSSRMDDAKAQLGKYKTERQQTTQQLNELRRRSLELTEK